MIPFVSVKYLRTTASLWPDEVAEEALLENQITKYLSLDRVTDWYGLQPVPM